MTKSIIELIASDQSAKAVAVVEKALGKKLLKAISEQTAVVARNTYGTLREAFGPDEQPEFMNPSDNTYAVFFANALKKFGVNGPEDFRDEATKQQFFQYVDNNWKAQDSVQGIASQAAPGPTMDQGTGTQLPATAPFNQPPQMPMQPGSDTTSPAQMGGGGNPSLGNMSASGGPDASVMNPQGDDPTLDAMGKSQNSYGAGNGTCQSCGQALPEPHVCSACGQTVMPGNQGGMPGQPMPGQQVQPGADMGDDDSDPDLEIGDSDQVDGDDDQFGQDPDDEQNGGFGDSDVDGDENGDQGDFVSGGDDENGDAGGEAGFGGDDAAMQDGDGNVDDEQGDGEAENEDDDDEDDDPFNDEDAYSVSPDDFNSDDDDPDGDGIPDDEDPDDQDDEDGDPDLEIGDDDDEDEDDDDQFGDDDDEDEDSDDDSDDPYDDEDEDDDDEDSDDDSDDEDEDDDPYDEEDDSDDDEVVLAPSKKAKNPFAKNENFGFKEDNDSDRKFITEVLDPMIKKSSGDPNLHRKLKGAKNDLRQIMHSRNKHFSMLKHRRREILNDHEKSPKQKRRAVKYISQLAKRHKAHCAQQAAGVKALHTGKY